MIRFKREALEQRLEERKPQIRPHTYRPKGVKRTTGLQFFDLADFSARNGLNDELMTLFDEALKRDPKIVTTVHEVKANRMVNVLLYFLSINSGDDAQNALDHLKNHYGDTRAYRENVATDKDVMLAIELILNPPPPTPLAVARPPSSPSRRPVDPTPTPKPADPTPADTSPRPVPPPAAVPNPTPRPSPRKRREPTEAPVPDASGRVRSLVAKGDAYFKKAMVHLLNSDPNINPDGWGTENKKALEYFFKANNEGYVLAQDQYTNNAAIPKALLDRVREATMRSSLCRKRSVSTR